MNDLITISAGAIGGQAVQTVNARDLHSSLGVGKDFSNWVKTQIKRADLVENKDFLKVAQKGELSATGQTSVEYHLTVEAAKNVAMLSGTAKGKEIRAYFIECERKALAPSLPMVRDPRTAMMIETLIKFDQVEQEQARQSMELAKLQENVAVIEARTQPENKHFTVMGYSNLIGKQIDIKTASKLGRKCADLSREQGMVIGDVSDPRFGRVHSYHESILQAVIDAGTTA